MLHKNKNAQSSPHGGSSDVNFNAVHKFSVTDHTSCFNKPIEFSQGIRGKFWVLYNYIKASRYFNCNETITYTTHGDYTFLDNLEPLLKR